MWGIVRNDGLCFLARWCPMSGAYIPKLWTWAQLLHCMSSSFWERPTLSAVYSTWFLGFTGGRNRCVLSAVRPEECGCCWNKHSSESESSRVKFHLVMWPLDTLNYFCRCFGHSIWIYPCQPLFSCVKFCNVEIILNFFLLQIEGVFKEICPKINLRKKSEFFCEIYIHGSTCKNPLEMKNRFPIVEVN